MKLKLTKASLAFLLVFSTAALAAPSATTLTVASLNRGRTFNFTVTPQGLTESCSFTIYGSANRTKLTNNPTQEVQIAQGNAQTGPLEFSATDLRSLRKILSTDPNRRRIYFSVRTACTGETADSTVVSTAVRVKTVGIRRVRRWLRELATKILLGNISTVDAFPALRFSSPVELQSAGDGTNRLFVVEQAGIIKVFNNDPNVTSAPEFLNITTLVEFSGELGLLGLAFHPQFASNGYLYVNYTRTKGPIWETVVSRFTASGVGFATVNAATELELLTFDQPFDNHNGGALAFGPDGYLYIASGDGGSGGDPQGNGQDLTTFLGKILRIDVNVADPPNDYSVPAGNPFVGQPGGVKDEIFAYGMRNPWRISFDSATLWAGDVGQNDLEEIDIIISGANYGWNTMEGSQCYPPGSNCDSSGLTLPILDYGRSLGQSITGGYVYRGTAIPTLAGRYIYGDFASGRIWALAYDGTTASNALILESGLSISTFGRDEAGEVYVVDYSSGAIYGLTD